MALPQTRFGKGLHDALAHPVVPGLQAPIRKLARETGRIERCDGFNVHRCRRERDRLGDRSRRHSDDIEQAGRICVQVGDAGGDHVVESLERLLAPATEFAQEKRATRRVAHDRVDLVGARAGAC